MASRKHIFVTTLDARDGLLEVPHFAVEEGGQGLVERFGGVLAALPRELFQLRFTFGLESNGFHNPPLPSYNSGAHPLQGRAPPASLPGSPRPNTLTGASKSGLQCSCASAW